MDNIRKRKRNLKKQMKAASELEKQGLEKLWKDLKAKHSALSKAESARKRSKEEDPRLLLQRPLPVSQDTIGAAKVWDNHSGQGISRTASQENIFRPSERSTT
eukprot:TRINITY_DN14328_c0_g1_i22.p1 TRINITY_DN14328_c0_g1~~TRINITY_DN14328_c0_g1_i22.p1  ORF type:complete len:103 (+),score=26.60 TRINITY_DN14328_c0_g1_i22:248-556(+)